MKTCADCKWFVPLRSRAPLGSCWKCPEAVFPPRFGPGLCNANPGKVTLGSLIYSLGLYLLALLVGGKRWWRWWR